MPHFFMSEFFKMPHLSYLILKMGKSGAFRKISTGSIFKSKMNRKLNSSILRHFKKSWKCVKKSSFTCFLGYLMVPRITISKSGVSVLYLHRNWIKIANRANFKFEKSRFPIFGCKIQRDLYEFSDFLWFLHIPAWFLASHEYTPASWIIMLFILSVFRSVTNLWLDRIGLFPLNHVTTGNGNPVTSQSKMTLSNSFQTVKINELKSNLNVIKKY